MTVLVVRRSVGLLEANCWIIADAADGPALIVDPGGDADVVLSALGDREVKAVILTHVHFDHLAGTREVVEATGACLMVHADDVERLRSNGPDGTLAAMFGIPGFLAPAVDRELHDGDTVAAGDLTAEVLHTPGHTRGGICLLVTDPDGGPTHLFSGDTLFQGGVGRTDLPGGDSRALSASIASKLAPLAPDVVVHAGHGPDTTIGREARVNVFWPRA